MSRTSSIEASHDLTSSSISKHSPKLKRKTDSKYFSLATSNNNIMAADKHSNSKFLVDSSHDISKPISDSKSINSKQSSLCAGKGSDLPSKRSSDRPLPKPLVGTEMLNASYTNALSLESKTFHPGKLSPRLLIPSKSLDNLADNSNILFSLRSAKSSSLNKCSHGSPLSQSWNDVLREQQKQQRQQQNYNGNESSIEVKSRASSTSEKSSPQLSNSLEQSISSRLSRFFRGSNYSTTIADTNSISSTDTFSPGRSREPSASSQDDMESDFFEAEEYHIEIFTVSKTSKFFNVLRESWIYSLIVSNYFISLSTFVWRIFFCGGNMYIYIYFLFLDI